MESKEPVLGEKRLVGVHTIEEISEEVRIVGLHGQEIEQLIEEKEIFKLTKSQLEELKKMSEEY